MSAGGSVCVGLVGSPMKKGGGRAYTADSSEKATLAKEAPSIPQRAVNILLWAVMYLRNQDTKWIIWVIQ